MKTFIEISRLRMQAFHGVLPQERVVGNDYIVDCTLTVDFSAAMHSDALEDTINYATVVALIREEMARPSMLLEHVAGRIVTRIQQLSDKVEGIDLRIAKQRPPIEAQIEACAVRVVV